MLSRKNKYCPVVVLTMCLVVGCLNTSSLATSVYGTGDHTTEGDSDPSLRGIYVVDIENVTSSMLFPTPDINWYGATDGDDTSSFFATPSGGSLYRIDVIAKTATPIGGYGGIGIKELAYNESSGLLYGTDYLAIYVIDTLTGIPIHMADVDGLSSLWAMDYDESIDQLIVVDHDTCGMYYVDEGSGGVTYVGDTGVYRVTDIWYDPFSGQMFGVGNHTNRLLALNTSTGAATTLGDLGHSILGLGNPIPEPATLSLLAFGGLALIRRRRYNDQC